MIDFYKIIDGGYISGVGTNGNDSVTEISEVEYAEILAAIGRKLTDPEGYTYKLRADDLEWELVALPIVEEPELSADEALDIILGGTVDEAQQSS